MKVDLADVTVVVDRSGSMASCKVEAEGGVNAFVKAQGELPGKCLFSLVQFDTEYEFVHRGVPIQDVPPFCLVPRGMTALLDAIGRAINETGARLAAMAEVERPGLVVFVIVTDGQENSSHEFRLPQIKEMIERQQKDYQWQFTFLGANQDAFAAAGSMGIGAGATSSFDVQCAGAAFKGASGNVSRMRTAVYAGYSNYENIYTDEERDAMSGKGEDK